MFWLQENATLAANAGSTWNLFRPYMKTCEVAWWETSGA